MKSITCMMMGFHLILANATLILSQYSTLSQYKSAFFLIVSSCVIAKALINRTATLATMYIISQLFFATVS